VRPNCGTDLKRKETQTAYKTHILREEKERFGTLCNTTASRPSAFVISRSSVRIRKAAPKRELTDATMASVFYWLCLSIGQAFFDERLWGEKAFFLFLFYLFGEKARWFYQR
jgi:hypothetical protein